MTKPYVCMSFDIFCHEKPFVKSSTMIVQMRSQPSTHAHYKRRFIPMRFVAAPHSERSVSAPGHLYLLFNSYSPINTSMHGSTAQFLVHFSQVLVPSHRCSSPLWGPHLSGDFTLSLTYHQEIKQKTCNAEAATSVTLL